MAEKHNCTRCGGTGIEECGNCSGKGQVWCDYCHGDGRIWSRDRGDFVTCRICHGSQFQVCPECEGVDPVRTCEGCGGSGEEPHFNDLFDFAASLTRAAAALRRES